jgi:hypothetical protein
VDDVLDDAGDQPADDQGPQAPFDYRFVPAYDHGWHDRMTTAIDRVLGGYAAFPG